MTADGRLMYPTATEGEILFDGVMPDMIRVSVGLESLDDILWDIDQALAKAAG